VSQVEDAVVEAFRSALSSKEAVPDDLIEPLVEALIERQSKAETLVKLIDSKVRPQI
jgi:hypothetical protein